VAERYPVNTKVIGRVVNVTDYGAFVELEPGVEGLIHISEMTWSRRMKHPSKVVKPGDQVEAVILEVHSRDRRISLGLKQLEPNPWTTIDTRYSVGSVVEGRVRNMTDFGAFIEIEEGIDGLVHVSDLSWTKRVKHPFGDPQEGADRAGGDSEYRLRLASPFAGHQATPAGRLGELFPGPPGGRYGAWAGVPAGQFRRLCGACRRGRRVCAISPKSRAIRAAADTKNRRSPWARSTISRSSK
jgi:predicted RNA-binding protein with RPS1 domain